MKKVCEYKEEEGIEVMLYKIKEVEEEVDSV